MTYRIKDWKQFQHFKDRSPPWVKLYRDILDDPAWHSLDPLAAKILVMLWLIASEDKTHYGTLPNDGKLAFRLRISEKSLKSIMSQLAHWLIQDDINPISTRYQVDAPERARVETETETETEEIPPATPTASKKSPRGGRLPADWKLPKAWGEWALGEKPVWSAEDVRQCSLRFADFWHAKAGKDAAKLDWLATWRNWVRNDRGTVPMGNVRNLDQGFVPPSIPGRIAA